MFTNKLNNYYLPLFLEIACSLILIFYFLQRHQPYHVLIVLEMIYNGTSINEIDISIIIINWIHSWRNDAFFLFDYAMPTMCYIYNYLEFLHRWNEFVVMI